MTQFSPAESLLHERACSALASLIEVMARLRDPKSGCAWDLEQTFETIAPYTLEEAYEVQDAIAKADMSGLREELGDLMFQVVFHARMAEEKSAFDIADVVEAITAKMIRRHPHVFEQPDGRSSEEQTKAWEAIKAQERVQSGKEAETSSALSGVALALPALVRAHKIQKRAARVGFDWPYAQDVLAKIKEEIAEVEEAIEMQNEAAIQDEIGDLLFAMVNLARHVKVDAEQALQAAILKFERRFKAMEILAAGNFPDLNLGAQEALWQAVKVQERQAQAEPNNS